MRCPILNLNGHLSLDSKIICRDFDLREHKTQYTKDLGSFMSENYDFMDSPYIQNGFIYFVG